MPPLTTSFRVQRLFADPHLGVLGSVAMASSILVLDPVGETGEAWEKRYGARLRA